MKTRILLLLLLTVTTITNGQNIYTIAGKWSLGPGYNGDSLPATSAKISQLSSAIAVDATGNIYIPDNGNHRIRKIDVSTGLIFTVAGTGTPGYNGDGIPAVSAQLKNPTAVAIDTDGNIYIADYSNNRIRKIDTSTGLISTIAGTGVWGYNGDSIPANTAEISECMSIALDKSGNIYFSELGNSRIRKIDVSTGYIYTIAGDGNMGYNGDSIPAITAQVNLPHGIAVDSLGNIYVADRYNQRIRKIEASSGLIYTVAGNGIPGYNGDGISADTANLYHPWSVSIDKDGNLFIADSWNDRIRKVDTTGIISTVAGNGTSGFSGDGGSAVNAQLNEPRGVFTDNCGNIYISDYLNYCVRKVNSFSINYVSENVPCYGLCSGTVNVSVIGGNSPYIYSWGGGLSNSASQTGLCAGNYTVTATDSVGCKEYLTLTITQPDSIIINIDTTNATCLGDGSASATVTGGASPYSFLWSTGDTASDISGLSAGSYYLTVTDTNNCTIAESCTINNTQITFASVPICMVTVDSLSLHNIVMWDKTGFTNIDSFWVYREISTGNYQPLASIPYNSLSQFVDTVSTKYFPNTGDPNFGTYRYKLQMLDSCGNLSELSPYHNTVFISNNNGTFTWTQLYSIENGANPVANYILMRDDSSNGNWHAVNSVAGTQQIVSDPGYTQYKNTASWRIETQWGTTCSPTLKSPSLYNSSFSNIYRNYSTSVLESTNKNSFLFYPNPVENILNIYCAGVIQEIKINNVIGECVYFSENNFSNGKREIDMSSLSKGVYFLRVETSNTVYTHKVIKN